MKRKDKHGMERKKGRSGSNRTILIHSNEERGGGGGGGGGRIKCTKKEITKIY